MKKISYLFIMLLSIISCKHEPEQKTETNGTTTPVVINDTVCFNTQILPLISGTCAQAGCHDNNSAADNVRLFNYTNIVKEVKAFNPNGSKLYEVITTNDPKDRMPPAGNGSLDNNAIALIKKWIEQGALNTICKDNCDTLNVTFSGSVVPVLNLNCKGCHNNTSPQGGIALDNYAAVKTFADNGKLLSSIKHLTGFSAMPKAQPKLSYCNIRMVELWIQKGALND